MPVAEIITIGTEILLGEILDTNARYLACILRESGIDLFHKTTVGDNPQRIAQAIQAALARADIVITSGGLGPTVDDVTRDAIALAISVELEYHPELWEQIKARFQRYGRLPTENNRRQAFVPQGAIPIENPVGTAPAFFVEAGDRVLISLPGVPRELEYLLENAIVPYLLGHFQLNQIIKSRVLHTAGAGESQIDERIGDLEKLNNPTVGLAAHAGQVDVRITAKAASPEEAGAMIGGVEMELRERLGRWVFGADLETLEGVALRTVANLGWRLAVLEYGLGGSLTKRLSSAHGPFAGGEVVAELPDPGEIEALTRRFRSSRKVEVALGLALFPGADKQVLQMVLISPSGKLKIERSYGGPPLLASFWATNISLDLLRTLDNTAPSDRN